MTNKIYAIIEVDETEAAAFFNDVDVMCDQKNFKTMKFVWQSKPVSITITT